jgi:hypothetical protein
MPLQRTFPRALCVWESNIASNFSNRGAASCGSSIKRWKGDPTAGSPFFIFTTKAQRGFAQLSRTQSKSLAKNATTQRGHNGRSWICSSSEECILAKDDAIPSACARSGYSVYKVHNIGWPLCDLCVFVVKFLDGRGSSSAESIPVYCAGRYCQPFCGCHL